LGNYHFSLCIIGFVCPGELHSWRNLFGVDKNLSLPYRTPFPRPVDLLDLRKRAHPSLRPSTDFV